MRTADPNRSGSDPEELHEQAHEQEHELLEEGRGRELTLDPLPPGTLDVPSQGLEDRAGRRKRVVIMGAGVAGLVAGFELQRLGHEPVILEAQNRS